MRSPPYHSDCLLLALCLFWARGVAPAGAEWFDPALLRIKFLPYNAPSIVGQQMKADRRNGGNGPYPMDVVVWRNEFVEFALFENPPGPEFDRNFVRRRLMKVMILWNVEFLFFLLALI